MVPGLLYLGIQATLVSVKNVRKVSSEFTVATTGPDRAQTEKTYVVNGLKPAA